MQTGVLSHFSASLTISINRRFGTLRQLRENNIYRIL